MTGEADAIARVRTQDNADLERLIMDLQRDGLVERTRSQVVHVAARLARGYLRLRRPGDVSLRARCHCRHLTGVG